MFEVGGGWGKVTAGWTIWVERRRGGGTHLMGRFLWVITRLEAKPPSLEATQKWWPNSHWVRGRLGVSRKSRVIAKHNRPTALMINCPLFHQNSRTVSPSLVHSPRHLPLPFVPSDRRAWLLPHESVIDHCRSLLVADVARVWTRAR